MNNQESKKSHEGSGVVFESDSTLIMGDVVHFDRIEADRPSFR